MGRCHRRHQGTPLRHRSVRSHSATRTAGADDASAGTAVAVAVSASAGGGSAGNIGIRCAIYIYTRVWNFTLLNLR